MKTEGHCMICDFLSSMIGESFIVFDFKSLSKSVFCVERFFDYEGFIKIIHPNDRIFLEDVCSTIRNAIDNSELQIDEINYFAFLLQISSGLLPNEKSDYFMTYVKLKPQFDNGRLSKGICLLSASVMRKQDNRLLAYYKNTDYSSYSFQKKEWEYFSFSPLTGRQKEMLIWAQQGFSLKETAVKMSVSGKTIENMRSSLFEKLGVSSIEQAIQYASNRRLIGYFSFIHSENEIKTIKRNKRM